jgi:hypothetical protein
MYLYANIERSRERIMELIEMNWEKNKDVPYEKSSVRLTRLFERSERSCARKPRLANERQRPPRALVRICPTRAGIKGPKLTNRAGGC